MSYHTTSTNNRRTNAELYEALSKGDDVKVCEICRELPDGPFHILTIHDDSVLHIACYYKRNNLVLQLINQLPQDQHNKLTITNEAGNTLLHATATNNKTVGAATLEDQVSRKSPTESDLRTFLFRDDKATMLHVAVHSENFASILDITFFNGYVYSYDYCNAIQAYKINGKDPAFLVDRAMIPEDIYDPTFLDNISMVPKYIYDRGVLSNCIVGLADGDRKQMLVIIRDVLFEEGMYYTKSFQVLAYDLERRKWSKNVKDFGTKTLFLGNASSFWVEDTTGVIKGWDFLFPQGEKYQVMNPSLQGPPFFRTRLGFPIPSGKRDEPLESKDSTGGRHWKWRSRMALKGAKGDLSEPYNEESTTPFTRQINEFIFPKRIRIPTRVKTYDGTGYPEDHLKTFATAARKRYTKDLVELHHVKQREGESAEAFMERFTSKSLLFKGALKLMRIFRFMHGITHPRLIKRLNDNISKTLDEMMSMKKAFIRREKAAASQSKERGQSWKQQDSNKPCQETKFERREDIKRCPGD
nr:ankyrin repeat-containing protein [Tanacetum cinerariifolium]